MLALLTTFKGTHFRARFGRITAREHRKSGCHTESRLTFEAVFTRSRSGGPLSPAGALPHWPAKTIFVGVQNQNINNSWQIYANTHFGAIIQYMKKHLSKLTNFGNGFGQKFRKEILEIGAPGNRTPLNIYFFNSACAAANLAIGTLYGEHET